MFRLAVFATCSLLALATAPASAQTADDQRPSLDRDVILVEGTLEKFGATKSETPILETARSISIETERDFRDKGFETLNDALTYMAGVTAKPFGFDMRGDFAAVRGLTVPEYRDNLQFLFGFYNNPRPELYLAEQVEVLKGPASVLYGAGSPGGIVNVVTKRPFDGSLAEVRGRVGNFDRYEIMGDFNTAIPGTADTGFARLTALYRNTGTQIDQVDEEKIVIAPSFSARRSPC
jgi:iron complex outermembrane receptor protein